MSKTLRGRLWCLQMVMWRVGRPLMMVQTPPCHRMVSPFTHQRRRPVQLMTTTTGDTQSPPPQTTRRPRPTGRLAQLPASMPSWELMNRAKRRALMIPHDKTVRQVTPRARKRATQQADAVGQAISVPLRELIRAYDVDEMRRRLHPFEFETARLTSRFRTRQGHLSLEDVVKELGALRNGVVEATKEAAAKGKAAASIDDASQVVANCLVEVESRLKARHLVLDELKLLGRALRRLPTVNLATPTVVLVGAPNVGKSTLVRELSTGEPTIGNYPFTTRGVTMGHVLPDTDEVLDLVTSIEDGETAKEAPRRTRLRRSKVRAIGQIMDTPGLLAREPTDLRNDMEDLTLATMRFLPSAVVFVMDLSGAAGDAKSSPAAQLHVRNALRAQFPKRPWIDVVAKADLLDDPSFLSASDDVRPPPDAIFVSVKHSRGLDDLRAAVLHLLDKLQPVAKAAYASSLSSSSSSSSSSSPTTTRQSSASSSKSSK